MNIREFYDYKPHLSSLREEIFNGLTQPQKAIAPKFFYDKRESRHLLDKGDGMLIGVDLKKDPAILNAAYKYSIE
ncbi:L-histidine N(alpha)-methyltransferase [Coleofasciculus sp. F4-SAH-05]|uniref:L-histidine N(alpha)-methyltransferase n=1 Tax=Coleofasciculus sp. F4-SAH-05 TaxID=3069525 RepID=UPI003301E0E0